MTVRQPTARAGFGGISGFPPILPSITLLRLRWARADSCARHAQQSFVFRWFWQIL